MIFEAFNRSDSSRPFSSSKGNQTKYHIGNLWYKEDYLGYEAASEYLCSQILKFSNIPEYVNYGIEEGQTNEENVCLCVSEHFLKRGEQLHTLHDLWEKIYDKTFYKSMESLSVEARIKETVRFMENELHISCAGEKLTMLLEFDAFVLNEDRHSNNIAFVERTDGTFAFAPVFDNGAAFLSDTKAYSIKMNPRNFIHFIKAKPFSVSFEKQARAAEMIYGKQLHIQPVNLNFAFAEIESHYGRIIANRMRVIYEAQIEKYADLTKVYELPEEKSNDEWLER